MVPPPDFHLLQAGDEAAWDAAFAVLWPDAFHVARRRLPGLPQADAEDVAVMAIRDAAAWVDRVGTFEELRALARCVAHRRAIDLVRGRHAARRGAGLAVAGQEEDAASLPDPSPGPWEDADLVELARWLQGLADALPPIERALLVGHYAEGRTHAELAAALGVARPTVGVRLHRALGRVRRLLAACPRLSRELHERCLHP